MDGIKKFILTKILRRRYHRTGKCKACGRCCSKIYAIRSEHVVKDEKEFEELQRANKFYSYLNIVDKDDVGLVFECCNLNTETGKCRVHKKRPEICRSYPREELFSLGGKLLENCGYKMEPIISFGEVLKNIPLSDNGTD